MTFSDLLSFIDKKIASDRQIAQNLKNYVEEHKNSNEEDVKEIVAMCKGRKIATQDNYLFLERLKDKIEELNKDIIK